MVRLRRPPASAAALTAALGALAIASLLGPDQAKVGAAVVLAIVVGIGAIAFVSQWSRVLSALLLVVLLIPNDGRYIFAGGLPFQLEPYRVVVGLLLVGWIGALLVDPKVKVRVTKFEAPLGLIVIATFGSVVVNPARVTDLSSFVVKALWLFICFVLVVYMTVSVVRTRKVLDQLVAVLVYAGSIVGVAAVVQRKTGSNIFDRLHTLLPFLHFNAIDQVLERGGAVRATASAGHPIELSSTMSMLMPLAIYLAVSRRQGRWWVAVFILLLGEFSSGSRTGILGIVAMIGVFMWLRPRQTIRCWPALLPMVVAVHFVAPGALGGIYGGFFPSGGLIAQQSQTFHGRQTTRLSRLGPSLHEFSQHNPLFGEGFGTRITGDDSAALPSSGSAAGDGGDAGASAGAQAGTTATNAQILDDEWLKTLLETGILGVLGWVWLFCRAIRRLATRARLERGSSQGWLPVAMAASLLGFAVSMGTYDAFSFIQATFLAFTLIAFSSILLQLPPSLRPAGE